MTIQHTPPSRLALAVIGLIAMACITLAITGAFISQQLREINRDNIEVHRIAIEATQEANRMQDAANARQEIKDAHSEGVNQGGLLVMAGAALAFGFVIATFAFAAHQLGQRNASTWRQS